MMHRISIQMLTVSLALGASFATAPVSYSQAAATQSKPTEAAKPEAKTEAKPAPKTEPKIEATPALWKIKGPHTTLYLFGTVHLMKPNVAWHSAKLKEAVAASQTLLEELSDADKESNMPGPETKAMIQTLGVDADHPLSTKISKEDLALLDAAMKQMGAPGEAPMEPLRPWLAALTIEVLPIMQAGYDPKSGVDITLAGEFRAQNKPVDGLETISEQLHFLADVPEAQQVESLHIELKELNHGVSDLDRTMAAWIKGDDTTIASIENDTFAKEDPDLYQRLVVTRNKAWAEKLGKMLTSDGPGGTVLVAVGAAHLAGPDSVLKMLTAKGYTVTQQ